jgi:alpha-ketoglutarate-dependent taurine dioxygenase
MNGEVTYRVYEPGLPKDANPLRYPRFSHPVLSPANAAGDIALSVSEAYASHIEGLSKEESEELLQECFATLYAPDNVYEHHWQPHDILLWNNLAVQHGRPKPVVDGVREFWRLKSFVVPGLSQAESRGRSALDMYTDYRASVTP